MPGRLMAFILILLIIFTFIGFNFEHSSNIRIWFGEKGLLQNVPIFLSFFVMYLFGVLSSLPFVLRWNFTHRKKERKTLNSTTGKKVKLPRIKKSRQKKTEQEKNEVKDEAPKDSAPAGSER